MFSMTSRVRCLGALLGLAILLAEAPLAAQSEPPSDPLAALGDRIERENDAVGQRLDELDRQVDDLAFLLRLGELAEIDMVRIAGPPPRHQPSPTAQGAGNRAIDYGGLEIEGPQDLAEELMAVVRGDLPSAGPGNEGRDAARRRAREFGEKISCRLPPGAHGLSA